MYVGENENFILVFPCEYMVFPTLFMLLILNQNKGYN